MTHVVDIPRLSQEADVSLKFNPNVQHLEPGTLVTEFGVALKTFCVLLKRLFPEAPIARIYTTNTKMTNERAKQRRDVESEIVFYYRNARNIMDGLFSDIFAALSSKDSYMKTLLGDAVVSLFSNESPNYLGMLLLSPSPVYSAYDRSRTEVFKSFLNIYKPLEPERRDFHRVMMTVCFGTVVLHQIENRLIASLTRRMARQGPMVEHGNVRFDRLLASISFSKASVATYVSDLNALAFGGVQESIYMRTLLAKPQVPSKAPFIVVNDQTFHRQPFESRGIFVNESGTVVTMKDRFVVTGCPADGSSACTTEVEFAPLNKDEVFITMSASRLGFSPALVAKTIVAKEDWMVFSFDRLDFTLQEALKRGMITDKDARDILALLEKFERANFVHHNLTTESVKVKIDRHGARRWYISGYGNAWYGGTEYGVAGAAVKEGVNAPYGYNFETNKVEIPNPRYQNWTRSLFVERPARFDAVALLMSVVSHTGVTTSFAVKKMFVDVFAPYVRGFVSVKDRSIGYKNAKVAVVVTDEREARLFKPLSTAIVPRGQEFPPPYASSSSSPLEAKMTNRTPYNYPPVPAIVNTSPSLHPPAM
jgi:hypothetical protein